MSGRRSKKNQRLGSSRRGPKGLNRNIEKDDDDDDGFQQIAESEDGRNEFHTSADYHSTLFDHPPSSSTDQQTSALESPLHAGGHKDSLMETELPERKRKMGSTRKSTGRFKVERKLDEVRTTEELDEEYVTQPNTSTTEEQHKEEQSRPMSFPSDLSLQTKSSGLGKEPGTTLVFVVSENEEKVAIHHQEITSHSHEVVSDMPIDETSVHSFTVTAESGLLREDSVMSDEPKTLSRREIPTASTSGQKRRMGSTRRPLGGKNSENVGVQEHSRNMTKNERKAEVMSDEMAQTWDDVARDDPSSHAGSSLVLNQSLLAERAELKEPDISTGTETMNQSDAFPLVDSEKPLPETSSRHGTPLLSEELDFKFASHTEGSDVLNKVLKDAGSHLSDNSYVPDTRKDTNPSYNFRDVNTETKEEVLKQKEELSINDQMSSLLPKRDAKLEELALNDQESSLSQHNIATLDNNCDSSMPQLIVGGSRSFDVPLSNISHDEPTTTNLPHEMSDAVEETQEIHIEKEQGNNLCNVASVTCDPLIDLESITEKDEDPQILATIENENMSDERGSETEHAFEMTDQDDARDHSVTQIITDVRDNEKDGETSTETIWISHQKQCEVSGEKQELYREQVQYSSNISQTHSPTQDDAGKMLENDEVTKDKKETENTAVNDVTSKSEEMFSFEDSATDAGSHAHQLLMQSDKEDYDLHENVNEKSEKEGILFSVESENTAFDRGDGRSERTEGIKEMDAAPVVILDVDTNDSESENPEQNRLLSEEQTDTSSDTNMQVLEVSNNVSTMIDSGLLLHDVAVVSSVEKSDMTSFIHEDSQYSYKPATFHPESQENTADAERVAVGGDTDLHLETEAQNKTFDSTTSGADRTEENIHDASVLVREVEVIGDTVTVESNMTTKLDFLQSSPDAHVETLKVSENAEKEVSGETDTILKHSDRIIPADHPSPHGEEAHSKSSPIIHKRKMGSTRRPLRGKTGQRQEHDEKEIFNLEDEPSTDASTLRSSKDEAKGHEMEISEKNDVGPAERSESADLQSSCSSDLASTAISICHVTESQPLTKIHIESQKNTGDNERVPAEEDKDLQLEIDPQNQTFDSTTSEAEGTKLNIQDLSVTLVGEVIGETVTLESNMTTESDFLQTFPDAHMEALKVSENPEKDVSGETDTILEQCEISIIPADSHGEETHSKSSPVIHKRKMGSTRRPLKGNKGRRKDDEKEILGDEPSPDQSGYTAVSICDISESQTLTKIHAESQENTGDTERVAAGGDADLHLEIKAQNKTADSTNEPEGTEKNIHDASVLVREAEVIGDAGTLETNVTTESDFLQSSHDAHMEALNLSENAETEVSGETDIIPKQSDISIIPEDTHGEEAHSKSSPVIHKRKMGSTRRPLKGNKGQRKEIEHQDENKTPDSEGMINLEKETFSLEDKPSPDESTLQSLKDGAKEQMEICEKNDVDPVEGSESALMQSSCSSDLVSEESTAISICHVTESQTLTKINEESQENAGDDESVPADLQLKNDSQNKTFDSATSEAEGTEENIQDVIGDTVTVESNMTTESDFLQTSPDAHMEALNLSENAETEVSAETDTIPKQSDISIIPEDTHGEEAHSKSSPVIHKRKMGSTRKPLRGNKGQRKETEHHDENEPPDSEGMINLEKETFSLEDKPSPDESTLQSLKDGAKEQMEICEKNDVDPVEGSESALMQSSCSSDLVSEESTAISICHITESQTLTKIHAESQENTGDAERVAAGGDADLHLEIKAQNKTADSTNEPEGTEKNIHDASVLVREAEVIGDAGTLETNVTTESDFLQSSHDAHMEALNLSENAETEVLGETDIIPKQSDISIIPEDTHGEEAHSKSSPVIHKRKMGSTRRPLKGNKGQRKETEYHDENETPDNDGMINVEKETIRLENKPSLDEFMLQISKDRAKEQEMEICEENDVGPVEGSESALLQSSCSSDLVSEESTAVSICHVTESQTLTKINEESQENAGDDESVPADLQLKNDLQNKTFDSATSEAEGTEENIQDVIGDTVTVESNMTTESDFLQTSPDAHMEALNLSANAETEVSGETDTIPKQSDISIIPEDTHGEEAHSKSSPVIHKRKMGSTRRPLKGNKAQRKDHDEKEIFNLEDEPSPDESTLQSSKDEAKGHEIGICEKNDVGPTERSESADLQSSCISDLVSEESTAISICHVTESQTLTKITEESQENAGDVESVPADLQLKNDSQNKTFDSATSEAEGTEENIQDVIGDTVTVESNMTTESDFLQTSPDAHMEALNLSANAETEVSGETDTIPKQSDISIIPEDTHGEEAHSKSSPVIHKRKMGSTRRPLKGNKGQRKETEYHDENETPDNDGMINVEKETISLENKPSLDEFMLQISKDRAKEQEMEICEENDVGPVEGSESALLQSSCSSDLVSEESTAVSICHVTESQTLTKINEESQENAGDDESVPADLQLKNDLQNKTFDSATSEAEGTEENIQDVIGDTVTVESNMTTESDFLQTSPDAHMEALNLSANAETEVSGETDTIPKQSDISIIPEDTHGEEAHSKSSPVIHKRKMGSTRRPLKGNKAQRKDHDEKEIFNLEDEPSPDESTLQSSKDEAKGHEMGICEKNDVGPTERSESADLQSSCISDLVSEESTAISICHVTESQTLTKITEESQENAGDVESVPADLQLKNDSQNKTFDSATSEAEGTEENIQDVIGDTVTVESNMTTESDFLQTSPDAHMEALNLSANAETEVSGETDTIPKQSDISIIPEDTHGEEAHSKSSPVIHKRKMGSTRRPLRGNKGQRKETEHHDENEPPDSEGMINLEKETFSLEDKPSPDESTLQSLKDGAKEQMEICEKNDVDPVEGSESALMQSSCSSDLVSEESTAISICHVTESQTLINMNEESQENTGDVERVPAEEDKDLELTIGSQNKTFDSTTSEAEGTEENIQDISVTLVREVEVIGDTVTVESNMTTESDFLQTSPDAHTEALKVCENAEKEVSGETDKILEQSDMSIIPAASHREETHSKSSPVIHKRKMGSTRRPLKGNTGRRKDHDEKEILEDEPSPDQSGYTAVSICDISEPQTLRQIHAGSQENNGDAERVPAEEHKDLKLNMDSQNKRFDLTTSEPEGTDQNIQEVSVMLVREVGFIGDTVSVNSNMTTESDLIQNDTSFEAKLESSVNAVHEVLEETHAILKQSDTTIIPEDPQRETLKVSENAEKEVSGETYTIIKQSDINIIPEDTHGEEAHSKSSPFVHKRKMGSTRRPLKGNKGQRKETEHQDENEPTDNDGMINVEKETISLENKPSLYESTLQISKDGAKEQEMEISEKNDVGPVEGSEPALLQSSCSSDSASEVSTAISICHITESQTLIKMNEESQENAGDAERAAAGGDADLQLEIEAQNKTSDSTTSDAEGKEENIHDASVLVREVGVIGDTVTVESNMTTELDFPQSSPDADEALKSENTEKEVSGERDTILEQSDIRTIPADSHGEEAHSKSSPIVHKRKMGSTRRPLKGKKGQRQEHDEKEIFNLEDEPSPDESTLQSSKDEAKGHEMGICEKNDVGPTERSESADLQSSCISDLVSEESTAISICHVTESQTLTKINEESQENAGDVESVPADLQLKMDSENKTFDLTNSEAEGTDENIQDVSVTLVREVEVIGDTVTVESNMTTESDFLQTSPDAQVEALKVSEIAEKEVSGKTDTIPKQSDISIILADSHREETHSKSSPVIHKRKMGSTRRPLKGNKAQRKDHDEKEIFTLEDEPSPDESRHTVVSDISESQTLTKIHAGSQENTGDVEIVPVGGDTESHLDNKTFDSTAFEGEVTEENICETSALVKEVKFIGDTVIVESNMTTESDLIRYDNSSEAELEALKVSGSAEHEVLEETDTIPKQSDTTIILEDTQREEAHSKLHPVVQKRKMGSTRRPLRGNKGQQKEIKHHDENETHDDAKEIFILENEPRTDEPRYTAVSDISESQTFTKFHAESQENYDDIKRALVGRDTEPHSEIQTENTTLNSAIFEREGTEETICEASDTSSDAKLEALISEIAENEISGKTDTVPKQSDTNIIFEGPHGEKLSLNVHKRKMGSTRRPLRGNKGQRKVGVESKEKNGHSEGLSEEEDTETHSEIQNRDTVVDHNVTQEILNIKENEDEERNITKTVDMSVQELCNDLELEQRSDVSQTQTGPSQDDTGSHDLLKEETQIHVSSDDVPPTEVAEMHQVSTMSVQKRKMGSTRKRGKRMVNEEGVEEEKEGEAENTTTDDGTTKSEENLPVEEAITGSPVHQQLCSSSVNKEQNDPNSIINPELLIESECTSKAAAEMVSDLPLGDVDTYLDPKQNVIPKESHREDQSNLNPVVQKRKMGSTRKTLRGNKVQGREGESKIMDRDEEMTHEHDTEPHLATSTRKTESKFDEKVEQNFLVAASNMFPESENEVKEVSQNIHDLPDVSEEKGMEHTGNDSNSVNKAINLYEGTKDKFVLTVSHEDVPQTMPTDYLDQHVGSEPEQTENTRDVIPTQELKNTQDDVHEISSQKIPATQEKRRKMGSTRRNPRVMHGKNMTEDRETKKAEDDLDDMPLASSISQSKEVSSVSTTDLESETLVSATDLKGENDHQNISEPSGPTVPETPENTLQICANQLVNADVTKHPQSETVSTEKRRKMGSTRKNLREGRIRGKRDGYEDTETADSEMSLVREDVGEQTTHDYSNQSENSLLSEIERALNKSSQSSLSCDWELIVKEPNPDDLANAPVLNMPENSEIKSLQPTPSSHSEPNSPGRRRRKMGSTRKNPRQELKAERDDEDKEDGEIDENLKTDKQEKKDLERVEVSVVHNITENKEYLDVSSAHTSSSQQEKSTNPVSQEGTSPSTKRKFGSRRANKGKQGLGRLAASDFGNELEDGDHKPDSTEVKDKLHSDDLAVCDPTLQPENQPITHPVSEQRNVEAKNEEAALKGTGAGLVSLDQIMKHDRSTGAKQRVNLKNRISNAEVVQFNIVMVGNSCVGKTSFVRRFHEGQFTEDYRSTIGVDTCVQTIALPDRTVKLQIWDTAGQERFHSITTQVFRKADGLLLMYEITSSNSFTSVRDWISQAREKAPDDAIMMLVGNKNDSVEREVQIQEGADLAREYNIYFMECSAATGANVSESMRTLAELLVQRKSQKEKHTTLKRETPQKKSGCC